MPKLRTACNGAGLGIERPVYVQDVIKSFGVLLTSGLFGVSLSIVCTSNRLLHDPFSEIGGVSMPVDEDTRELEFVRSG